MGKIIKPSGQYESRRSITKEDKRMLIQIFLSVFMGLYSVILSVLFASMLGTFIERGERIIELEGRIMEIKTCALEVVICEGEEGYDELGITSIDNE